MHAALQRKKAGRRTVLQCHVLGHSEVQCAGSLLLFILSCSGASASNLFQIMSEEKQVMYKLLEARGKHVGLCVGRVFYI